MRYVHEITLKELFSYFSTKGYKLTNVEPSQVSIGLEESIIAALLKKEPRLIEGIPILLKKNKVNYQLLADLTDEHGLWNEMGYITEFTSFYKRLF